jgi:hypothetical protein
VNFGTLYVYHLLQDNAPGTIQVVSGLPSIVHQPSSITVRQNETATFTVTALGSAPLSYQWQRNGSTIVGALGGTYTTPALTQTDSNTTYACVVTNSFGSVTSSSATLTVLPPIINVLSNPSFETGTTPWVFWTNGSGSMTQASSGTHGTKSAQITLTAQGTDVQLYQSGLKLEPNTQYKISFDAYSNTGHDLDVSLIKNVSPYTNYGLTARKFDLGTSWGSFSATFTSSGFSSEVTDGRLYFSLASYGVAGDVYHIDNVVLARVSDLYPPSATPPGITMEPLSQTVVAGQTATFTVTASGTAPISYQWQKNHLDISGATTYSYSTPPTTPADSGGAYRCRVTNGAGADTSADARLTVITPKPPVITVEPHDTSVVEGNPARFAVVATGDTVLTYQWEKNGTTLSGATLASYNIAAASRADSGSTFRCIVSNPAGKDTSRASILSVRPLPPTLHLATPDSGGNNLGVTPNLTWRPTPGALAYQLQLSRDSTFAVGAILDDTTITDTIFQVHGLAYATRYYWHVKAQGTGGQFSATWYFTTGVGPAGTPVLFSPINSTAGLAITSIDFTWQPSVWATSYRLQIATDSLFATGVASDDSTLTDTTRSVTTLQSDQHYFWHVSARGPGGSGKFSDVWWFETIKTAPLAASLVFPGNGASAEPVVGLTFRWNRVASATRYKFQLSTDSTFSGGFFKDDTALVDTARIVNGLAAGTEYYWRVRARNSAGWGSYSPAWSLATVKPIPGIVFLQSPAGGAVAPADSDTFTWRTPSPGASHYWFELGVDSTFSSPGAIDSAVTDTVKVVRRLANGRYYWRVRGVDLGGWGPFSETRSIRVVINSVAEYRGIPETFVLEQNHPNPFNPSTKIGFGLPVESRARVDVYNLLGERIATLLDGHMRAGYHTLAFDASSLPSGIYIYRLTTDKGSLVRKMILMK